MRKSLSYPCPFCNVTSEKRATAQEHAEKHVALLNRRVAKRTATKRVKLTRQDRELAKFSAEFVK